MKDDRRTSTNSNKLSQVVVRLTVEYAVLFVEVSPIGCSMHEQSKNHMHPQWSMWIGSPCHPGHTSSWSRRSSVQIPAWEQRWVWGGGRRYHMTCTSKPYTASFQVLATSGCKCEKAELKTSAICLTTCI